MNRSLLIAILMAIAAVVWILSGSFGPSDTAAITDNSEQQDSVHASDKPHKEDTHAARFQVRVASVSAESMSEEVQLQGEVVANREVEIRAETQGSIASISANKGTRLKPGEVIANIAMNDRQARLEQAKAELKVRKADLEAGIKLKAKRLLSENQHERNLANVVAAEAAVKQIQVEIKHTQITAAFTGVLDELHVEVGDYVSSGDPVAKLVDDTAMLIRAQVPQQYISQLELGQAVSATLLDNSTHSGAITYISSSADQATRTFMIEAKAQNESLRRFGQSARVTINLGERMAHKLSPSVLDLANDGSLRVKGIDENNRVISRSVTILRNENDGVWLSGLPEQFELITVGQGFVSEGELVDPIRNESLDDSLSNDSPNNNSLNKAASRETK